MQKQDPEELNTVCKVVEDLIQMQTSIFVVSNERERERERERGARYILISTVWV